ncbi:hypothetical protein [Streptomyces spiramenti]|uniref:Uncharacterized protein n=1 Tax=Streptomyces spiramenti TaxID=2720606 RepID=A0ABX1ARY7_9ACTN|nr:hypothetical protein [Streptomyces spiramenti]NJP68361.1 hypothetical protein [Streptomyces spiramenti]
MIDAFCDLDTFVADLGLNHVLDGVPAVELELTELDGAVSRWTVAARAPHHVSGSQGEFEGQDLFMGFEFDEPVDFAPPADDESRAWSDVFGD